eukprot:COSAG02_NODE_21322_length_793_cov_1.214697_1_plen_57_part_01
MFQCAIRSLALLCLLVGSCWRRRVVHLYFAAIAAASLAALASYTCLAFYLSGLLCSP